MINSNDTAPEAGQPFWARAAKRFFARGFRVALVIFMLEVAAFFITASVPYFPGEQQSYAQQAKDLSQLVQGKSAIEQFVEISANNLWVAAREMIPALGAAIFSVSIYQTARIIEALSLTQNLPASVLVLVLFFLPHSWIELAAYPVAVSESLFMSYSLLRWFRNKQAIILSRELEQLVFSAVLIIATLLLAAAFEVIEGQLGVGGLVMWAPFAIILVLIITLSRRYRGPIVQQQIPQGPSPKLPS